MTGRASAPVVLVAIALVAGAAAAQGDETAPVRQVDELVAAAVARYPGLRADQLKIDAAQAKLKEAKLSPFFQFEGRVGFSVVPDAEGTPLFSRDSQLPLGNGWGPSFFAQLRGAIPVYTFGKIRSAKKAAKAGIEVAESQRDRTLSRVVFDVRRAYFGLQLGLDLQQMISEGKGKLERAIAKLDERLEDDDPDVDEKDRWQLVAALAEIEARESEALQLESLARTSLQILTGYNSVAVPECPLEVVPSELLAVRRHIKNAERNRPELRALKAAERAGAAKHKIEKSKFFPDFLIALSAAYSRAPGITDIQNPFIQDLANNRQLAAGLVARWSLDFAGAHARTKAAKSELESIRARAEELRTGIKLEVVQSVEALAHAKRRVDAWKRGEKESRQWFISAAQGYQVGTQQAQDLVQALKEYFKARAGRLQATAEYNVVLGGLERITGVPLVAELGWRPNCE